MRLYGIRTCDTCRKALRELSAAGHDVEFIDVRATALPSKRLSAFLDAFGPALVNRSSATWRGMTETERAAEPAAQITLHPALMKRPVIEDGDRLWLGWGRDVRSDLLG